MCPRSSGRVSKPPAKFGATDPDTAKQGFDDFDAPVSDEGGDGSQSTSVRLRLVDGDKTVDIAGTTGSGCGHAEMHALHQALTTHRALFESASSRTLTCTEKPCCFQCSVILGLLDIDAGEATNKSKKPMGSTEWGASAEVKAYVTEQTGVPFEQIAAVRGYPS